MIYRREIQIGIILKHVLKNDLPEMCYCGIVANKIENWKLGLRERRIELWSKQVYLVFGTSSITLTQINSKLFSIFSSLLYKLHKYLNQIHTTTKLQQQ